jgi:hypothetical protein
VQSANGGAGLDQAHFTQSLQLTARGTPAGQKPKDKNATRNARRVQAVMRGLRIDNVRSTNIGVSQLIPAQMSRLSTYQDASRRCCTHENEFTARAMHLALGN